MRKTCLARCGASVTEGSGAAAGQVFFLAGNGTGARRAQGTGRWMGKEGMATEVLGFLIIMGMLVVVVLNRQLWQRPEPSAPSEDMEDAARRLRREMEQSADEIISRTVLHSVG